MEKSESAQERSGVDGQLANLIQAAQQRPSFIQAQDNLKQIGGLEQQRSEDLDMAILHASPAAAAMRDLVMQLDARQSALKETQAAFEAERQRWTVYYGARIARAQTECAVTRGIGAATGQGKQK